MISITCTNCESVLTIDDAFAGGVCRCQFCGTIQTVPSKKEQAALKAKVTAKSLYQKENVPPRSEASGTGLEHLGGGISGSGLVETEAALRQHVDDPAAAAPVPTAPVIQPTPPAQGTRVSVVLITAAVVVVTGIAVAILLSRMTDRGHASQTNPNTLALSGPNFCGIPVTGNSVIYLIDRGNSINEFFDAVKAATYKSLKQLGPDRKFQVILWDNDAGSTEFPSGAMRNATAGAVEDCQRSFQDLTAGGSSHLAGPLREALARKPQYIVVATAKSQLEDDDTDALRSALGSGTHLCFLQIGPTLPPLFEDIAKSTGGQAKHLTPEELREFSK